LSKGEGAVSKYRFARAASRESFESFLVGRGLTPIVMARLVRAIHDGARLRAKKSKSSWMAATSAAMTNLV
jgi:hypothetical protein